MKKLPLALAIITLTGAGSAVADTVNTANVTTFESGAPAVAVEVNSTVQALITAIDSNAETIAALQAELTALTTPVTLDDLVGRTYCQVEVLNRLSIAPNASADRARISAGIIRSTLTFTSVSELSLTSVFDQEAELLVEDRYHNFGPADGSADDVHHTSSAFLSLFDHGGETEILPITGYSGGTLTADGIEFQVSPDGNIITVGGMEPSSDPANGFNGHDAFYGIAIRCN